MKRLLIVAAISTTALAAAPLLADQSEHRHDRPAATQSGGGHEHGAQHGERHAEMQKRMQERHARMASQRSEEHGAKGRHGGHGNSAEGCPMHQQGPKT